MCCPDTSPLLSAPKGDVAVAPGRQVSVVGHLNKQDALERNASTDSDAPWSEVFTLQDE